MRRISVLILDLLFICAWAGGTATIVLIASSFISNLTARPPDWIVLGGYGKRVFWSTVLLWIGLTALMLLDCYRTRRNEDFKSKLWTRVLLLDLFVVGPTAYYIGSFRPRTLSVNAGSAPFFFRKRIHLLDALYFLSFWGSIAFLGSGVATFALAYSVHTFQLLATVTLVLLPLSGIATIVLMTILLLDAIERPKEIWERVNFLKLLNPWSWVFGMRKYYLHVLRPELRSAG